METTDRTGARTRTDRHTIQKVAMMFGGVFLVVGVLGFIPGITTNYDRLSEFDGEGALLLGAFGINLLENGAHLAFGIAGLLAARTYAASRTYFLVGGAVYIALWIYGLVIDINTTANVLGINEAANWLHFAIGAVMIGIGALLSDDRDRERARR
jgi:arginine exporter protein ArgO